MQPGSLRSYQKIIQDWENKVGPNREPSERELNELNAAVALEFCRLQPDYNTILNPESETSFLHTFFEAVGAFGVFCRSTIKLLIWPVILLRRKGQHRQK